MSSSSILFFRTQHNAEYIAQRHAWAARRRSVWQMRLHERPALSDHLAEHGKCGSWAIRPLWQPRIDRSDPPLEIVDPECEMSGKSNYAFLVHHPPFVQCA